MPPGVEILGRPKRNAQPPPSDKPASHGDGRETVIHMKGSPEYVAWVEAVHRKTHIPKVQIFRLAVADWASKNGHPLPPDI